MNIAYEMLVTIIIRHEKEIYIHIDSGFISDIHPIDTICSSITWEGTVSDFEELVRINRDANAIYFELVEDGRSYAFRYSFNKVSDGDSNGSNIKKINDNWLLIADE